MTMRILLCTLGTTPQIASETAYSLLTAERPWAPDRIEIVTTGRGIQIMLALFPKLVQALADLPWPKGVPPIAFFAPTRDGAPFKLDWPGATAPPPTMPDLEGVMPDITKLEETHAIGDLIKNRIDAATQRPDAELHVSIAGGRKTMSAQALLSLALLGRPQDEASHVIIGPPFEDHRDFWHPLQSGGLLHPRESLEAHARHGAPLPLPTLDPRSGKDHLSLVRIPIPYVADIRVDREKLRALTFAEISRQMDEARRFRLQPSLRLWDEERIIEVSGRQARLPAKAYVLLRILATAQAEQWDGMGPEGRGGRGWLSLEAILGSPGGVPSPFERTLAGLKDVFRGGQSLKTAEALIGQIARWRAIAALSDERARDARRTAEDAALSWLKSWQLNELRAELDQALGLFTSAELLKSAGRYETSRAGLACPAEAIAINPPSQP